MLPPSMILPALLCITCMPTLQKQINLAKTNARSHPEETSYWCGLFLLQLCTSLSSDPLLFFSVMSCTLTLSTFFAHNISKVTPALKQRQRPVGRRSFRFSTGGVITEHAWMKTYPLTREDMGTTDEGDCSIPPHLFSIYPRSGRTMHVPLPCMLTTSPFHAN